MGATIRHLSMKNNQRSIFGFLHRILISGVAVMLFVCTTKSFLVYGKGWTRGRQVGTSLTDNVPLAPFTLDVWSGDGNHVNGLCTYHNANPYSVEIDGQETRSGEFYPDVIYEISNGDGKWQTLEVPKAELGRQVTITVESKATSRPLRVSLDMFARFLGKARYGRLVLKSGESAVFQLDELQAPDEDKNTK
jgi:hypothetical protein